MAAAVCGLFPIGGSTDFMLDNGVVTFRRLELDTAASHISATGTLRIEDVFTNLQLKIHSTDFSELDRAGFNFAHSAGKNTYTLLGLGGSGDISGAVKGKLKTPQLLYFLNRFRAFDWAVSRSSSGMKLRCGRRG